MSRMNRNGYLSGVDRNSVDRKELDGGNASLCASFYLVLTFEPCNCFDGC